MDFLARYAALTNHTYLFTEFDQALRSGFSIFGNDDAAP